MKITVNGEPRDVNAGTTVLSLLQGLNLQPQATVVQRNADIVDRNRFGDTALAEGDALELVRFVGGG